MIQALPHLKDDISVNSRNHLIKYVFFRFVFVLNTYDSCILEYMRLEWIWKSKRILGDQIMKSYFYQLLGKEGGLQKNKVMFCQHARLQTVLYEKNACKSKENGIP